MDLGRHVTNTPTSGNRSAPYAFGTLTASVPSSFSNDETLTIDQVLALVVPEFWQKIHEVQFPTIGRPLFLPGIGYVSLGAREAFEPASYDWGTRITLADQNTINRTAPDTEPPAPHSGLIWREPDQDVFVDALRFTSMAVTAWPELMGPEFAMDRCASSRDLIVWLLRNTEQIVDRWPRCGTGKLYATITEDGRLLPPEIGKLKGMYNKDKERVTWCNQGFRPSAVAADYYLWWARRLVAYAMPPSGDVRHALMAVLCGRFFLSAIGAIGKTLVHELLHETASGHCSNDSGPLYCCQSWVGYTWTFRYQATLGLPTYDVIAGRDIPDGWGAHPDEVDDVGRVGSIGCDDLAVKACRGSTLDTAEEVRITTDIQGVDNRSDHDEACTGNGDDLTLSSAYIQGSELAGGLPCP